MNEGLKHTQGPWRNGFDGPRGIYIEAEDGTFIGYVARGHKGNTALVTAAPDLLAVALAYEEWEADLILDGDWSGDFVRMKAKQHDRMLELQAMRNAAVRKATGRKSP